MYVVIPAVVCLRIWRQACIVPADRKSTRCAVEVTVHSNNSPQDM